MRIKNCILSIFLITGIPYLLTAQVDDDKEEIWQPYYINQRAGDQHIDLNGTWLLSWKSDPISDLYKLNTQEWISTQVPGGTVHWSLYRIGKYPDMYANLNSKLYEWVEDSVWYYKRNFDVKLDTTSQFAMLVFDGIDYFSKIWLNGELLGHHQGMFGGPAIEVSKLLKSKGNELIVEARSGKEVREKGWPGRRNPKNVIKGWEFTGGVGAEPFYTVGLWQGVRLELVPKVHMERPYLFTQEISTDKAILELKTEIYVNDHSLNYDFHPDIGLRKMKGPYYSEDLYETYLQKPLNHKAELKIELLHNEQTQVVKSWDIDLFEKRNWLKKKLEVPNPKLWWPNGLGTTNLYKAKLSLIIDGHKVDEIPFDFGIRKIETVPSAGPQVGDTWDDWHFKVNGKEIFVKGINWMPADLLLDLPQERYDWLIDMAKNAGIQMFRIWGVGLIEPEEFYRACNRNGIMVWAEYSMANVEAKEFPQDVYESQVMWTIFRLRNHPSLAVHCGGNEYNAYSIHNTPFTGILERSVELFDPIRIHRRSSPDEGSIHCYPDMDATWYARLYKNVPFIAETGIHSITEPNSLKEVIDPQEFEDLDNIYDEAFKETHPEFIHHFVEFQANRVPKMLARSSHMINMQNLGIEELAEASQVAAGEFYQVLSELTQYNYPVTTGLIPWTYKRPWPVVSAIHLVDGFGQPSAPYYFLKRTYNPIHVGLKLEHTLLEAGEVIPLKLFVLNSLESKTDLIAELKIYDQRLLEISNQKINLESKEGLIVHQFEMGTFKVPKNWEDRFFFIVVELKDAKGDLLSRSTYWPRVLSMMADEEIKERFRTEPQPWPILENGPWLKLEIGKTETKLKAKILETRVVGNRTKLVISIENRGSLPSFMTKLDIKGAKRRFFASDNYFWLAAGEQREIKVEIDWREGEVEKPYLNVNSWNTKDDIVLGF